jgi:hypothetical protein
LIELLKKALALRSNIGKSALLLLSEALSLRLGRNNLGLSEYFDYGVWDPSLTAEQRREFIGWRVSAKLDRILNDDYSRVLANDKLINYLVLSAGDFSIPAAVATYSTCQRSVGTERKLSTKAEVRAFLSETTFPLFVKPISAGYGRGVLGLSGWQDSRLTLIDGRVIQFDDFFAPFEFPPYRGMLFQKCLDAHPAIAAITGSQAISCVRMICFVTPSGPVIHTAFWKIVTGSNMLDNFSHGDFGNCLGAVELDSGTITHAISRMGPGGEVTHHPTTGKPLLGFVLPDWQGAKTLVTDAAQHFPGLGIQNWDVALCPAGPVLLELNTESELAIPQAINRRGLMDTRLREIIRDIKESGRVMNQLVRNGPPIGP